MCGRHYTFNLTKKEVLEFSMRTIRERIKRRFVPWIIILLFCILNILIAPRRVVAITLWMLLLIALVVSQSYVHAKKALHESQRTIWVENAMLKMQLDVYYEIPLNCICTIRMTRHLILLGDHQPKKPLTWYPIPLRVFESPKEQEAFLELIRHPQQESAKDADCLSTDKAGRELFHFMLQLDEEKWVQLLKDERAARFTKPLGIVKRYFIFLITYCILVVLFTLIWALGDITQVLTTPVLIFTLIALFGLIALLGLKNLYSNPEKRIRRQLKLGLLQNHFYRGGKISVFEHGMMADTPEKRKSILPWETLGWLVETELAFYLFKKDKVCYAIVPKECLENWDQAVAMCRLCEEKNIPILRGRKAKYIPGWIFYLLILVVLVGYMQAVVWITAMYSNWRVAEQIHNSGTVEDAWGEDFFPADYSDYVPLKTQVEVLRSLGFTVPQEIVDQEQKFMDEGGMYGFMEEYPYTALLTVLGMPTYNEEWEITGYSDEVLWFDFEGMDISTDYIVILEGMKALADGSCIDSVDNIHEDISRVDWENGLGMVTVSFEWHGDEYSCQMDVEYDWIDGEILGVFNSLLEQDNAEERFYVTGDDGQGALVFFGTADWAAKFEKATGLDLDYYVTSL